MLLYVIPTRQKNTSHVYYDASFTPEYDVMKPAVSTSKLQNHLKHSIQLFSSLHIISSLKRELTLRSVNALMTTPWTTTTSICPLTLAEKYHFMP